jgi:hypothetical protein
MFTTNHPSPHNITSFCHEIMSPNLLMCLVSDEMMKEPNLNIVYEAAELLLLLLRMLPFIRGRLLHLRSVFRVSWQPFGLSLNLSRLICC